MEFEQVFRTFLFFLIAEPDHGVGIAAHMEMSRFFTYHRLQLVIFYMPVYKKIAGAANTPTTGVMTTPAIWYLAFGSVAR